MRVNLRTANFKISYCAVPCKILKFHVVSIGCHAELARYVFIAQEMQIPRKKNTARTTKPRLKF
ncbi:hypothetical protein [uncultured Campylobacter sp.]|uniref:hypothetical protein n=1 Tax=uncultured Campylobacter sp. TaxID=218934 RepID=UPI0026329099|nr:hypothetical protein [uncultured Campylobacter sp.]